MLRIESEEFSNVCINGLFETSSTVPSNIELHRWQGHKAPISIFSDFPDTAQGQWSAPADPSNDMTFFPVNLATIGNTLATQYQSDHGADPLTSRNSVSGPSARYISSGTLNAYTSINPAVSISSVTSNSFGEFDVDEIVKGVSTGTSAYVASWNTADNILKVTIPTGDFAVGEVIVGAGASYRIASIDSEVDGDRDFASNETLEFEADQILDFSERNPFGEF